MAIIVPRRIPHFQKPEGPVEIDWSHPFTQGLRGAIVPVDGDGPVRELVSGNITNRGDWVLTPYGMAARTVLSGVGTTTFRILSNTQLSKFSLFLDLVWNQTSSDQGLFDYSGTGFQYWRDNQAGSDQIANLGATSGDGTILSETVGLRNKLGSSWFEGGSNNFNRFYLDGKEDFTATWSRPTGFNSAQDFSIGSTSTKTSDILLLSAYVWDFNIPSEWQESLANNPYQILKPRRRWVPVVIEGGAGATVSVGLAAELSSAFAISRLKQKAVGLSAENDAALATSPAKVTAVGLSAETDAAFSILRSKIKTAGLSTETDAAFALIISSAVNLVLSDEADSALAISRLKQNPAGLSTETDAALSVNRSKIKIAGLGIEADVAFTTTWEKLKSVGLSSELDQALAISSSGSLAVGLASELDVALVIGRLKQQVLGLSTETDLSQPVSKIKTQQAGLSAESDAALAVTGSSGRVVGLATETDLAQSISRIKQRLIGLAPETDVALAVTIAGVTVVINTSAKETLKLLAENPTLTLSAENETLTLS